MKLVLNLTLTEARKTLAALDSPSVTDLTLTEVYYKLKRVIEEAEARKKVKKSG